MLTPADRAWHERRLTGWGGSQAASLLGISPWTPARIGVEDKGRMIIVDPDAPERLRLRMGREMEPILLRHLRDTLEERTGARPRMRRSSRLYRSPRWPFMIGNVDGFADDVLAELKTDVYGYLPWGAEDGDPAHVVPAFYYVQVQHDLEAAQRQLAYLFVNIGLAEERLYTIPRDDAYIADLAEVEGERWADVVAIRARLAADPDASIDDLLPDVDGTEASRVYLKGRFPVDDGQILIASDAQAALLLELRAARAACKAAKAAEDELENRIRLQMADHAGWSAAGVGTITYRRSADGKKVAFDLVAAAYRGALEAVQLAEDAKAKRAAVRDVYRLDLDAIQGLYTKVVPGSRRLVPPVTWDRPGAAVAA